MALLIETGLADWMSDDDIANEIRKMHPDTDVRTPDTIGDAGEITMVAVVGLQNDHPKRLPNLKLVQKLGAGVETIVSNPNLPDLRQTQRL